MNYIENIEEHSEYTENLELLPTVKRDYLKFYSPSELLQQKLPKEHLLAGDMHVVKGNPFVIGGAPGVGKSRAATALAVAGALGTPWFGLEVHRKFKTMILQAENGLFRLQDEYRDIPKEAEDWIRVTMPPNYGFAFDQQGFIEQLTEQVLTFKPDLFIMDPWTRHAKDDGRRDYIEDYEILLETLPIGNERPAVGIIAHTRKPQIKERADGRALMHTIAGSFSLASIARSVFVIQSATDEPEDKQVVFTCCKNNDGELGASSAWERQKSSFSPLTDFDWDEFKGTQDTGKIELAHVRDVLKNGKLKKNEAVKVLKEHTGACQSACYNSLKLDGRFGKYLKQEDGYLFLKQ